MLNKKPTLIGSKDCYLGPFCVVYVFTADGTEAFCGREGLVSGYLNEHYSLVHGIVHCYNKSRGDSVLDIAKRFLSQRDIKRIKNSAHIYARKWELFGKYSKDPVGFKLHKINKKTRLSLVDTDGIPFKPNREKWVLYRQIAEDNTGIVYSSWRRLPSSYLCCMDYCLEIGKKIIDRCNK
jgi:hypothetical protein